MAGLYEKIPEQTIAYHNDATDEYFGYAASGTATSQPGWQIFKIEYTTSYSTAGDPWVIKWAVDATTGLGSNQPKFEWDEVENYSYRILGT